MSRPPVVLGDAPDAAGSPWLLPAQSEPPEETPTDVDLEGE